MKTIKEKPFFSIITVCFNAEQELEKTILSVINQSFQDFEYIIIDGQSTDMTLNIANKYNDKIKIISEKDNGIYDACNKGIKIAKGKYVNILMAGDYHLPNFLYENYDILKKNEIDFIYGGVKALKGNGKLQDNVPKSLKFINEMAGMPFAHPTLLVRTSIAKELRFDESYRFAADFDFICKLYLQNKTSFNTQKSLTIYTLGGVGNTYNSIFETIRIQIKFKIINLNFLKVVIKQIIMTFLIRNKIV